MGRPTRIAEPFWTSAGRALGLGLVASLSGGCTGSGPTSSDRDPARPTAEAATTATDAAKRRLTRSETSDDSSQLVADDGRTLWASPTAGEPIPLALVPEDVGLFAHLRPARLLATAEGPRAIEALGPSAGWLGDAMRRASGTPADTLVVAAGSGESYGEPRVLVSSDPEIGGDEPLLPREFESLLATSDRERYVTLIFSPRFLLGDGGALLSGWAAPLGDLLRRVTRDNWKAASLSVHLDASGRLYWELRVIGSAADAATVLATTIRGDAASWPRELRAATAARAWSAYSSALAERSPAMLDVIERHTRRGADRRHAVLNGYAPPGALSNALLVGQRLVAEWNAAATPAVSLNDEAVTPAPIAERLAGPVTVSFRRESLESALTIVGDAAGVPIAVVGRDLQLEGITRNQMVSLDVTETPASDAIVSLLRQANPDPLATGPGDPRQKLVYSVGEDTVTITTRAAAATRGEPLPPPFDIPQPATR